MISIESSYPKLLATIAKVETDEETKSHFEAISASILLFDPVVRSKVYSNRKDKKNVSDAGVASIVGDRHRETKIDLRFYGAKENKTLSNKDKSVLREWHLVSPTEFGQSKKRVLDTKKGGKGRPCKNKKKHDNNVNDDLKVHVQSASDKVIKSDLKNIIINDKKEVTLKLDEASTKA